MNILSYTLEYLEKKFEQVKINKLAKMPQFWCPLCHKSACQIIPHSGHKLICHACSQGKNMGTIIDVMSKAFKMTENEVIKDMKKVLNLDIITNDEQNVILDFYEQQKFDMVQIARNKKIPIEKEWTVKNHRDKEEWKTWLREGSNIGVKTGKISNITVIDVDQHPIPDEIKTYFNTDTTLSQKTNKGYHFFFKYEKDLPKTRIDALHIDIENDGGQVVVSPSTIDNKIRKINMMFVAEMPKDLKEFLLSKIKSYYKSSITTEEQSVEKPVNLEEFNLKSIQEGNRHNVFMHLGGILRKNLNLDQAKDVLTLLNRYFANPPLSYKEFNDIVNQLDKYSDFDDKGITQKILAYLRIVEDATARDVREALGFKKERIDKALSYLIKEQYVIKKRRLFHIIKKVKWKDTFADEGKPIDFKMPYFDDHMIFREGDMLVIGAKQKVGKSHIALNIVKRLIEQGKKPYYLNLESGNRYATISKSLSIIEGTFWNATHFSPEQVDLERNAITIIDWLLPDDYAGTDKLYKYFAQQLVKNSGNLIIFVQLKDNGDFFAKNMIAMFPAFVTRYFYTDEDRGIDGQFVIDYMREPKFNVKRASIPCRYDWESKELKRIDELNV